MASRAPLVRRLRCEALEDRRMLDGQGFDYSDPVQEYDAGFSPRTVVAADVDGDGHVDLVTATGTSFFGTVSVLRNLGDGTFIAPVAYAVGTTGSDPSFVTAADVDADGHVDLITANRGSDTVSVLRNLGDGTFAVGVGYAVGRNPVSVTAADVDGDGHIDLVAANSFDATVSVLRNLGDGTFASRVDYEVGRGPRSVTVADVDGDGNVDLIAVNERDEWGINHGTISILPNRGDGVFDDFQPTAFVIGDTPSFVAAVDVDGNGRVDLVIAKESATIANSGGVTVLRQQTGGGWSREDYTVNAALSSVTAVDVDGDGHVDLVTANKSNSSVSVMRNLGGGTFTAPTYYHVAGRAVSVTAADVNGDGYVDLVAATIRDTNSPSHTVSVLRNSGDGRFAGRARYAVGSDPHSVAAADVDGDGCIDLTTANLGPDTVSVLRNLDGAFFSSADYAVGVNPVSVTAADVDGDGHIDLVAANSFGDTVSVLINLGNGTFAASVNYAVGRSPRSVVTADVNGDGHVDLITTNTHSVSVLQNLGDGTFIARVDYSMGESPSPVTTADIDGDGHLDLVAGRVHTISMRRGLGDGTFADRVDYHLLHTAFATAADVDGDGHIDLITANEFVDTVSILRNLGNGTFAARVDYAVGGAPWFVTAADVNGDGHVDLVTTNGSLSSNSISVLRNLGNGTFAARVDYAGFVGDSAMTAADVDGDSRVDLVTASILNETVLVLRNLETQDPATPLLAGDFDGAGFVGGNDFLHWQRALGTAAIPAGSGADGDRSGAIDSGDLTVWKQNFGVGGTDDHGNSAKLATPVSTPSTTRGVIGADDESDWFFFSAISGLNYRVTTSSGTLSDSSLSLYDADGMLLAFDNDGGTGNSSRIEWTAPANGTYYVAVRGDSAATGTYNVEVSAGGVTSELIDNATVWPSGPRDGASGQNFFTIEGSGLGSFASYAVGRFNSASIKSALDAAYGAGGWNLESIDLLLTESVASFSASGPVSILYTSDDATSIVPGVSPLRFPHTDGEFPDAAAVADFAYIRATTGTTHSYRLYDVDDANAPGSLLLADDFMSDATLTLLLVPESTTVAASYAGISNATYDGPRLLVSAHPKPNNVAFTLPSSEGDPQAASISNSMTREGAGGTRAPSSVLPAKLVDAAMAHYQWLTGQDAGRRTGKFKPLCRR